jgi:magnesium chelatase family protein
LHCSPKQVLAYQNKLSGPLRDRFDIFLSLQPVDLRNAMKKDTESSGIVRKRVEQARKRQFDRYGTEICNGRVSYDTLIQRSPLTKEQERILLQFSAKKNWSNRTEIKVIRLARTISDLQGYEHISDHCIWKAVKLNSRGEVKNKKGEVLPMW